MPRGPDVLHRIRVPAEWLDEGAMIELELPRNMKCAGCQGGGCDACERSGAISVRGRQELGELVRVTLPKKSQSVESTSSGRSLVIRIPERGGMAADPELPRGLLLLTVVPADEADPGIERLEPPKMPEVLTEEEAMPPSETPPVEALSTDKAPRKPGVVVWLALFVMLWVLFLLWLRLSGRG